MSIVDEDIAKVRDATDIVAIISQHTQLRKVGRRWSGLCPFHSERSPSFSVNQTEGLYYCFGCGAKGDVITFVREIEHLDFAAAVEWLAGKAGIALTYTERNESETRKRVAKLHKVVAAAVEFYHQRLLTSPDGGAARSYLRSRGFDRDLVEQFQLGWAPDAWDALARTLGVDAATLEACGLGFVNRVGKQQDFFRARVLFPIFDVNGHPVAFGGRKLPDTDGPKYQNSRENLLYSKSHTLYGLNWAKAEIVSAGEAVVCEGYTDVIGFARAGLSRAVATCGTALTEDHIRLLKRFTNRIVLAYDADDAGQNAAERVYAWEQRHEIEIAVIALPPGCDPDELGRSDAQALRSATEAARPFLGFRLRRMLESSNLASPEGRARAAEQGLLMVKEHPSALVRDQYIMEIAGVCRIEPEQLRHQLTHPTPRNRGGDEESFDTATVSERPQRRRIRDASASPTEQTQREALRVLIADPHAIRESLFAELFDDHDYRGAFLAIEAAGSLTEGVARSDEHQATLLYQLSMEEPHAEPDEVVGLLVVAAAQRCIDSLTQQARLHEDPLGYAPIIGWLKLQIEQIRDDEADVETTNELIAWLKENAAEFS